MEQYIVYITLAVVLIIATIVNRLCDEIFPIIWIIGGIVGLICGKNDIGMVSFKESIIAFVAIYAFTWVAYFTIKGLTQFIGGGVIKGYWMCAIYLGRYVVLAIALIVIFLFYKHKTFKKEKIDEYLLSPRTMPIVHIMGVTVLITVLVMKLIQVV